MENKDKATALSKAEIRQLARSRRDRISADERRKASARACERLFASPLVSGRKSIMLYASIGSEVDTAPFFAAAQERAMRIAYPRVVRAERFMEAVWIESYDQLAPGVMGILEPQALLPPARPDEIDLIIVPGLAFDPRGYRIGYGAGYYDRFLPKATRAVRIGLTYDCCIFATLPYESHDERVHWLLSETSLRETGG